jgi:hypothetical protein
MPVVFVVAQITNCYNAGAISAGYYDSGAPTSPSVIAGGICGDGSGYISNYTSDSFLITDCSNAGDISATAASTSHGGGICGSVSYFNLIGNSCNLGNVSSVSSRHVAYAGGIAGIGEDSGSISNCYSIGDVLSNASEYAAYAGGIFGSLNFHNPDGNGNGILNNCYVAGSVLANSISYSAYAGGICGTFDRNVDVGTSSYIISNCVTLSDKIEAWGEDTRNSYKYLISHVGSAPSVKSGNLVLGDIAGSAIDDADAHISLEESKTESTYTDIGWNFNEVWNINSVKNDGLPFLSNAEPAMKPVDAFIIASVSGIGGSIHPFGTEKITSGGAITFTITPNNDYVIDSVRADGVDHGAVSAYTFNEVIESHIISASFTYIGDNGNGDGNGNNDGDDENNNNDGDNNENDGDENNGNNDNSDNNGDNNTGGNNNNAGGGSYTGGSGGSSGGTTEKTNEATEEKPGTASDTESTPSESATTAQFNDTANHWAAEAISFVVAKGLFNGVSETEFAPNAPMTRAMFATVLSRYAGGTAAGTAGFGDVPAGKWYTDGVLWAAENGIVSGTGDGLFDPNGNITREQLAVMLYNYAKFAGLDIGALDDLEDFADSADVSEWATEALQWAVASGLISGKPGDLLDPKGPATRAEVATILQRFITGQ